MWQISGEPTFLIIIPIDDSAEHDKESTVCGCNPKVIFENNGIILIHNAFDGRQYEEQIQEILRDNSESA